MAALGRILGQRPGAGRSRHVPNGGEGGPDWARLDTVGLMGIPWEEEVGAVLARQQSECLQQPVQYGDGESRT